MQPIEFSAARAAVLEKQSRGSEKFETAISRVAGLMKSGPDALADSETALMYALELHTAALDLVLAAARVVPVLGAARNVAYARRRFDTYTLQPTNTGEGMKMVDGIYCAVGRLAELLPDVQP